MIKEIEKKRLGIIFQSEVGNELGKCASAPFADNADLAIKGGNVEQKIQEIINLCEMLCAATGVGDGVGVRIIKENSMLDSRS